MTGTLGATFRDAPAAVPPQPAARALQRRLDGLAVAVTEARGRLDDDLLDEVAATTARATGRLGLSGRHTVVAIAGATGSGKSTVFNALAGTELSTAGAQRPTTAVPTALVCSPEDADVSALLDWLGIAPDRRRFRADLPPGPALQGLPDGLVLLDLPDHDSLEVANHREAERVVRLADALVWVVDPQKYADAAIHQRFLRPLAGHRAVTMVVLNQIDTVAEAERTDLLRDLRQTLVADGMRDPRLLGVSARTGQGMRELRTALRRRVEEQRHAEQRAAADVTTAAGRLAAAAGSAPREVPATWVLDLERRLGDASGVATVAARVERTALAASRTSWRRWGRTGRPEAAGGAGELVGPIDTSAANAAVRSLTDQVCRDLTDAWGARVRSTVTAQLPGLTERLDAELAALRPPDAPLGEPAVLVAARLGAVASVLGGGVLWAMSQATAAAALVVLGALLMTATRVLLRKAVRRASARRADAVDAACRQVIARVARAHVLAPLQGELASYRRFRVGLDAAEGEARRR